MNNQSTILNRRTFLTGSASLGLFSLLPSIAYGETAAEKQAEADTVRNQLVSLQADLEAASIAFYAAESEREAAELAMQLEQVKIDEATAQILSIQEHLGARAQSMYRSGSSSFLDFILGSASFEEFTQNWDILTQINEDDASTIEEIKVLREGLTAAQEEYARLERVAAEKAAEAQKIQNEVQEKVETASALVSTLDAEAQQLLELEQAAAAATQAQQMEQEREQSLSQPVPTAPGNPGNYGDVVSLAMSRIGCPYVWGAKGPDTFDCSGLVVWAYAQIGIYIGRDTEALYAQAKARVSVSEARPGDVLYRYGHVGIAINYGGSYYVHAPTRGTYVRDTDPLSWSQFTCALQF